MEIPNEWLFNCNGILFFDLRMAQINKDRLTLGGREESRHEFQVQDERGALLKTVRHEREDAPAQAQKSVLDR